jgi:hypothetical protein
MREGPGDLDRLPYMSPCDGLDNGRVPDRQINIRPRVRFTLGQVMIAVAVIAALMGGVTWAVIVAMIIAVQVWTSRRRAERLGGDLLLQVVRPWLKQLEKVGLLIYPVVLIASLAYLALKMPPTLAHTPASYLMNKAVEAVLPHACVVLLLYWPCFRWTRLEFRKCGVVYDCNFWSWESIREWGWKGRGDILRMKVPYHNMWHGLAQSDLMWYGIAPGDKEPVQEILEQHLGLARIPTYTLIDSDQSVNGDP